jgi:hypothetical protein
LADAGLTSLSAIGAKNPREIELILNRPAPFGNRIRDSARHTPRYCLDLAAEGTQDSIR